jgi:deoxyribodipyrimidine photolyase-like uncharacterized protein
MHLPVIYDNQTFSTTPKKAFQPVGGRWNFGETDKKTRPQMAGHRTNLFSSLFNVARKLVAQIATKQISRLLMLRCQLLIFD